MTKPKPSPFLHMYDARWKAARAAFLRDYPLCRMASRTAG